MKHVYRERAGARPYPTMSALAEGTGRSLGQANSLVTNIYREGVRESADVLTQEDLEQMAVPGTLRHVDTGRLYPNAEAAAADLGISRQWVYACGRFEFPFGKKAQGGRR